MSKSAFSGGAYIAVAGLCTKENNRVAVIIPSLVLILERAEREKGEPLTEAEVISIRDRAPAIQMDRGDYIQWMTNRVRDIDPANVWAQWRAYKQS